MFKFIVLAVILGVAFADHIDKDAEVKSFNSEVNHDGSYQYSYDTSNGISAQESGTGGLSATGSASWVAPDGTPVQLQYIADENGYQPQGSHIPTPPPVPEHVLRALEWIRTHPEKDEPQHRRY